MQPAAAVWKHLTDQDSDNYCTQMKRLFTLVAALATACSLFSQTPLNDNCSGLIDLGTAPVCPGDIFSNVNATSSDIGNDNNPTCFNSGVAEHDVWFMFTCPDTLFDFRITLTGVGANSIQNPEFAVYRGDCAFDGLAELLCAKADVGDNTLYLDVTGLTPGLPYFIRVSDYSQTATPNWGDFMLCVDKIPPVSTIDQGSSSLCEGTLYDTGGADGDYGPNEDFTFVICPNEPSACITFTLEYFNIEDAGFTGTGDFLTFYDGDNANGAPITQINGFNFNDPVGGGAVCFQVQATSGCLTVQFQSDGTGEYEGWKGKWECSSQPCPPQEKMTVNTSVTPQNIVDAVSTPATVVTLTNIDCADGAYGTFSFPTDNNGLGLDKGLVLTSGSADLTVGPNSSPATGIAVGFEGDEDLDYLSDQQGNGQPSFDACVVEFDVFVATNELSFEYVFGSDEYPEYVNSSFNDIFAFLVSGPGIAGDPGLGGAKNIAVLPGTNTPVQINSVNNLLNWQYYRNNQGVQTLSDVLEYDGLTSDSLGIKKSLTARTNVIPCNTYHLKLAVADRADGVLDSGVFMSKIQGGTPDLKVQFASGIDYFIEDCSGNQDQLIISLSQPLDQDASFIVTVGGTATLGVDYLLNIPATITFPAGQTSLAFPIVPLSDNLPEGVETITITLSNYFGCGTVVYKTLTVNLADNVIVNVKGGDTLFVCAGATLQLLASGASSYFWSPPGAVSNPFLSNPTITPTQNIWLEVTGTISSCVDVDSVFIQIIDPSIDVVALTDTNVCQGTPVFIQANNNVNNTGLVWSPTDGLNNPNSPSPVATPSKTTTYTATISIAGCTVSDQVTINIDTLFFPTLTTHDTTVCQNYPVQLGNVINSTTDYSWTPATGLSDPASSGPIALPDVSTVYTLVATSANKYCSKTESVAVNVIAADVDILGDPYKEICLGDTLSLTALSNPAGSSVKWSPSFYVSSPTGQNVLAFPDESTTIIATYNINNCVVHDSIRIRVDSLPDQTLMRVKYKPIYCPGDTVYLISKTYEPANFPDIKIEWLPFAGQETPLDLWNMVITATTTHIFERVVNNHACKDTSSIEVPVAIPPMLTVDATPPQICPGQSSQIMVTVDQPGTTLEWQDMPPTLSCSDCPDPTASPTVTTTYTVTTPDAPCPSGASVTIVVLPTPALNLAQNPVICPGGSVLLNNIPPQAGVTYTWTPATGLDNPFTANPTATPPPGTNQITYTVNAEGPQCSSQGSVLVTVASATIDAGQNQTICFGEGATLTAVTTGTPGNVTWTPGNHTGNTFNVNPPGSTTYTATLVYGSNCSASDTVRLTVNPGVNLSQISAKPDPSDTICIGVPVTLEVTVSPAGSTLVWTQAGTPIAGISGDSVTFVPAATEGAVEFKVIATSANGCTDEAGPVTYTFKRCVAVPNAFTPGGDEVNDTFGPLLFGSNTEIVKFLVFNRWGQKVFESTPGKQRWDGKVDGKDAPSDVYAYYILLRYANGVEESLKGDVTLLR